MSKSQDLVESILSGHEPTVAELDDLLEGCVPEDLHLEYKHGDELLDKRKASATLRRYVSGFGNSAGGILIIGVDERTWSVTGCTTPGGGNLATWASRCLTPIAVYFHPPPRLHVISHPKGKVLVAATSRSEALIPCREADGLVFYFRFYDQTLENKTLRAPDYLLSDIVLGRRQHPFLGISRLEMQFTRVEANSGNTEILANLHFIVENDSLVWAEDVSLGTISWTTSDTPLPALSSRLLSYLDCQEPSFTGSYQLRHASSSNIFKEVTPFDRATFSLAGYIIIPRFSGNWYQYTWKTAAYLVAKGTPPIWFQISLRVDDSLLKRAHSEERLLASKGGVLKVERLAGGLALVAWSDVVKGWNKSD